MHAAKRLTPYRLIDHLLAQPQKYEFFQAVRVLSRQVKLRDQLDGDRSVGERIRFGSSLSLAFPASEVESLTALDTSELRAPRYRLIPAFIGMTGPSGAMPRYYTELLAERQHTHRDHAAYAFTNVFTNRMVALFYKAWEKYRLPLRHENGLRFKSELLSLAGYQLGLQSAPSPRTALPAEPFAAYAGLLRHQPVSADNLQRVLADYFDAPVEVDQFVGQWFSIPRHQQSRLGSNTAVLGQSACVGARLWDRQTRLRLTFGPLRRARYHALLAGGTAARELAELVQYWCGMSVEFEVQLVLHRDDAEGTKLNGCSGQLGRDAMLLSQPPSDHLREARYYLN